LITKKPDFFLLLFLAKKTRLFNNVELSTCKIALEFGGSQQTVSRKLRRLKEAGFVNLVSSPRGCEISLTKKGIARVKEHFLELQGFFSGAKSIKSLEGTFSFGIGEGKYYIAQKQYLEKFSALLGFKPYLGTLNLIVDTEKLSRFLLGTEPVFIEGFETGERSFGSIKAFHVKIFGKTKGAIIIPERTKHEKNVIEIISPVYLRRKYRLKAGSKIKLGIA